jgi:hypothetical protein
MIIRGDGNVVITGSVTASGGSSTNWNTAYGWGDHASGGYAADNTVVKLTGNQSISGTKKFAPSSLVIEGTHGTISFMDTSSAEDNFYIHVNSNNFYVLADRDGSDTIDGGYETPHPLQLEGDTNKAYVFGTELTTSNWNTAYSWGDHSQAGYTSNTGTLTDSNDRNYITDSRGAARAPSYYDDRYAQWDFQNVSDTGVGGDGWHALLTVSKWASFDPSHRQEQLIFSGDHLWRRTATSDSAWGTNKKIWDSGNLTNNSGNWNTAYGWGDHASAGYLTSLPSHNHDGRYLLIGGKAVDSDKLDGIDSGTFMRRDTNVTLATGSKFTFHSGGGGTTFSNNHYSMGVDIANGGWSSPNYSDLIIGYHTGIRIGAAYGGTRFYNNSPTTDTNNTGNGNGNEGLIMTVGGNAGSNSIIVQGNVTASGGNSTQWNQAYGWGNHASGGYAVLSASNSFTNSYNEFGNGTGSVSNDGSWNARVNVAGTSHARLDVKSVSDGIITSMYSHTGNGAGKIGTMSNHPLKLMVNGNDRLTLDSSSNLTITGTMNSNQVTAGKLNLTSGSYEGSIVFGSSDVWHTGIRQHDDADAELRIWAKNNNGMIFLSTGYDGEPANISRPTDGLVVGPNNKVGIGNFSVNGDDPNAKLHIKGSTAGETIFNLEGTSGQLFSVTDDLTGDLFTVSDISGIPILSVNSLGTVTVDDTLHVTGDVIAYYASDKRLKDNIKPIENAIDKIKMIGGYEFDWNSKSINNNGHDVGVIAQEIEEVLPELVGTRGDGYKGVKYEKLTALLIEAIKDQQIQIDELKSKLEK